MSAPHPSSAAGLSMAWLPGLLMATFVIGTDDFIIAGILPELAVEFGVSEAVIGQLVTVFSLVYAVAAPVMALLTSRLSRRVLIVGGLAVFAVVNIATVLAPTYTALLGLRIAAAIVGAAITPAAFATAGSLAPADRTGRAVGVVAAGLTISLVIGVPLGSWIGGVFGWQATFLLVAALTLLAVLVTAVTLPRIPAGPLVSVRDRLVLLRRPAVLSCMIGTIIGATAGFMPYTFIAPILADVTGADRSLVPVAIGVIGVAGALGTVVGGRLNDRWGADHTILIFLSIIAGATILLALIGPVTGGQAPFWLVAVLLAVWGTAVWGYNPPMNTRALRVAGAAGTEAVALNTSGLYIGIAIAGAIGGVALSFGGGSAVLTAAAIVIVLGLGLIALAVHRYPSTTNGE